MYDHKEQVATGSYKLYLTEELNNTFTKKYYEVENLNVLVIADININGQ